MSARIRHAHLFGTRETKYEALARESVGATEWTDVEP